jgi:hypothetical protein
MSYELQKFPNQEIEALDGPTLYRLSEEDYKVYLRDHLFLIDHHDTLRSGLTGFHFATTKRQFELLMQFLEENRSKIGQD